MKRAIKISSHINENIKVGDIVKFIDGSSMSFVNKRIKEKNLYIIYDFPHLFNSNLKIEDLEFKVVANKIKDNVTIDEFLDFGYITDIIVENNGIQLYTCSKHVNIL